MGDWVEIPTLQLLFLILLAFVLTQIGEVIASKIHISWQKRTGRRMECQHLGCVFKISSSEPDATKLVMENHQREVHHA